MAWTADEIYELYAYICVGAPGSCEARSETELEGARAVETERAAAEGSAGSLQHLSLCVHARAGMNREGVRRQACAQSRLSRRSCGCAWTSADAHSRAARASRQDDSMRRACIRRQDRPHVQAGLRAWKCKQGVQLE
eukprot:2538152-Pleurochrysis_carterae.AAC.2